MTDPHREIFVYAHWQSLASPVLMGVLHGTRSRGSEIFSFEYSRSWLDSGFAQHLDPDLQLLAIKHIMNLKFMPNLIPVQAPSVININYRILN